MSQTFANIGGAWPAKPPKRVRMINRTGAATAVGDLVAQNRDFAAVSGQAMTGLDPRTQTDGAGGWIGGAACSPTTAKNLTGLWVAAEVIADNAVGWFVEEGECLVNQNGSNAGEFLCGTNAATHATPYTAAELAGLTTAPVRVYGIALEAGTSGTPVRALWNAEGLAGIIVGVS